MSKRWYFLAFNFKISPSHTLSYRPRTQCSLRYHALSFSPLLAHTRTHTRTHAHTHPLSLFLLVFDRYQLTKENAKQVHYQGELTKGNHYFCLKFSLPLSSLPPPPLSSLSLSLSSPSLSLSNTRYRLQLRIFFHF